MPDLKLYDPKTEFASSLWFNPNQTKISRRDSVYRNDHSMTLMSLFDKQWANHWGPNEFDFSPDKRDLQLLSSADRHVFMSNLSYQILMDSEQEALPIEVLYPLASDTELRQWISVWALFETIHSRSYTNFLEFVVEDQITEVMNAVETNIQLKKRANTIELYYNNLASLAKQLKNTPQLILDIDFMKSLIKALRLNLVSVNFLEGIRFYLSFACAFSFVKRQPALMEKNALIISAIMKDETLHLLGTQFLLNRQSNGFEGKLFKSITEETVEEEMAIYETVVAEEHDWADYLCLEGEIENMSNGSMKAYVNFIGKNRLNMIRPELAKKLPNSQNPYMFMDTYLKSDADQTAQQETQNTKYVTSFKADPQNIDLNLVSLL